MLENSQPNLRRALVKSLVDRAEAEQNSRCVLLRGTWFSSTWLERSLNGSARRWRARWPEDDPSKPPLRLNIPKDTTPIGPYEMGAGSGQSDHRRAGGWLQSTLEQSGAEEEEDARRSASGHALEDDRNSSKRLDSQNSVSKSKSSVSVVPDASRSRRTGKNFKLRKIRSRDGIQLAGARVSDGAEGNDILTIQIALDDGPERERTSKEVSEVEAREDITSDEQIRTLAEAIVKELRPRDVQLGRSTQPEEEEAFLVIINVTDKEEASPVGAAAAATQQDGGSETGPKSTAHHVEANAPFGSTQDGSQVRNLEFSGEVDKILFKRKTSGGSHPRRGPRRPMGSDAAPVTHVRSVREIQDLVRLSRKGRTIEESRQYLEQLQRERHGDTENHAESPGKARTGLPEPPVGRKVGTAAPMRRFRAKERPRSAYVGMARWGPARDDAEYTPERGMRTRTRHAGDGYHVEGSGGRVASPAVILKPLWKQVVLVDEVPEVLSYPELKFPAARKSGEWKTRADRCGTMRRYHKSCSRLDKLTRGVNGEKGLSVTEAEWMGSGGRWWSSRGSTGKGDDESSKADRVTLRKRIRTNLDVLKPSSKLSDLKGSNDIYLQDGKSIGGVEVREVEGVGDDVKVGRADGDGQSPSTEGALPAESPPPPSQSVGATDERSEYDIADVTASTGKAPPTPPSSKPRDRKDRTFKLDRKMAIREIAEEKFEMNENCLRRPTPSGMEGYGSRSEDVGDSLLNTKKDAIINVMKEVTPKLSDNIVNLANEDLAEGKGTSSLDSLSMMKRVKEIVDLDLKNAERIFVGMESGKAETTECQVHAEESATAAMPVTDPTEVNSVVIYDEDTNRYHVKQEELELAMMARREELQALDAEASSVGVDEGLPRVAEPKVDVQETVQYAIKTGESALVYNETTNSWNLDFTTFVNPEREQQEATATGQDTTAVAATTPQSSPPVTETPTKPKKDKPKSKKEPPLDAMEIRRQNSNLYDDVFVEIKKAKKSEGDGSAEDGVGGKDQAQGVKKLEGSERVPTAEHYVSDNIVEMSKASTTDKGVKFRSNKVETVKLNISGTTRPPSKVTEINLNKKSEEGKGTMRKEDTGQSGKGEGGPKKPEQPNGTFYKKFEKYKTPFSDPEYEDKPMKINSDPESNPNLKKLDSWNKTLVLQEISKSSDSPDGWIKDETDKMATLLLKVLQEAAEGNSRRRIASKASSKGNPYEAIRKKQETNSGLGRSKKKEPAKRRALPVHTRPKASEGIMAEKSRQGGHFPAVQGESHVEVVTADSLVPKDGTRSGCTALAALQEVPTEDIPGPTFLKKLTAFWRFVPAISCQATIFVMIRMFQMAKLSLSMLSPDFRRVRSDPFGRLFTRYGPIVKLQGPLSGDVVLINRPEDITNVFAQAQTTPARSVLDSVENCRVRARQTFPLGITDSCNGPDWDLVRKSAVEVSSKGCLQYFVMLKNADEQFLRRIHEMRNNQNQVPDHFVQEVKKWSMEGLCTFLFDKSLGFLEKKNSQIHWIAESERLMRHLTDATNCLCQCESHFQMWRFFSTPAMSGLNQAYQSMDLIISKYVYQAEITLRKKRKSLIASGNASINESKHLNFLESILLNDRMTPDEISANLIDIMLIGANTTTVALSFLLYNLAQNSRVQRQLFRELKDLLPTKDSQLNYHQLHSLKYLQACLKESLRLNIPVPFVLRVLPSDIALANYRVPVGTHMVMDAQTACMREQCFDEPERFKPERWLDQDCVHPFASIPFCNGPRSGFVKHLAEIQLWTCAAKIIRNYQIEYHFGEVKGTGHVISYPDKPLKLTFIERDE